MYVKRIEIENLRSFKKADIRLSQSINLLIGNNNSGKSTILKSLYRLQSSYSFRLEDVRVNTIAGKIFLEIEDISQKEKSLFEMNEKGFLMKITNTNHIKVFFGQYTHLIETKRGADAYYTDLNNRITFKKSGSIEIFDKENKEVKLEEFKELSNLETQNNFIYPFFAKRKTRHYSQSLGSREIYSVGDDFSNLTSKISKISNPSHPKSELFNKLLDDILGFRVGVIPSGDSNTNTGIYVTDNSTISIDNMGEGVVNIVGLIVTLLTEDRKLYLLEEIENDIHPKALKKLLELILAKSHNNQFVISTHSNIVLKYLGIKTAKIFNLSWKPFDELSKLNIPTTVIKELANTPENKLTILEELGYDIFDFDLYKSYIIFEESSAESIVRDFLIPIFVPELENKIKTVSANGVDDINARLSDFMRLFVFIHQSPIYFKKAWIIADGDTAGLNALEKVKEKFSSWPQEHFINLSKNNIEEFYPQNFQEEFKVINRISDRNKKRSEKITFTNKVKQWIEKNPEAAKKEFKQSAKEIINYLQKIAAALKDK